MQDMNYYYTAQLKKINSAIQKDDAKIMIPALFQQNENLGGVVEEFLDNVSADDCDKSTNAKATKKNGIGKS